jgi:hypothetical protein
MGVMQASTVGDSCSGAVGGGDLVLISAGPSYYASVNMVASEARRAGELAVPAALTALHLMHCQIMWRVTFVSCTWGCL